MRQSSGPRSSAPRSAANLTEAGVLAVVLAALAMLVYIWIRFEWQFAVGAIATLVLDVTKAVGFFALHRARLQPHGDRGAADPHRLFGERQGRGL